MNNNLFGVVLCYFGDGRCEQADGTASHPQAE